MFSGFNLSITKDFFGSDFDKMVDAANRIGNKEQEVKDNIKKRINQNYISASLLSEEWFPQVNVDVFISHSSKDKDLAYALAGWLYDNFKIKSFIDSVFWKWAGGLLNEINDDFSEPQKTPSGCIYNYEKCNKASEHVNIMLNAALHKMIDKTESVFFLNTDNSIRVFNRSNNEIPETYSPWIFSELLFSKLVGRRKLQEYRMNYDIPITIYEFAENNPNIETRALNVVYEAPLDHLEEISGDKLNDWLNMDGSKFFGYPLDGSAR